MNFIKRILLGCIFTLPQLFFGQYTDQINSNRPGETMSAFSVGKTIFQVETGIFGIHEKHDLLNYDGNGIGIYMTLRYGAFLEELEFIVDAQYQFENMENLFKKYKRNDFRQTTVGAKYLIYDPFKNKKGNVNIYSWKANHGFKWSQLIPAVSVYAGANFVFKDNPYYFSPESEISPKVMLITQNHFGDGRWVLVSNFIADYITTDYPSYGYILTLTRGFNDKWSGFVENQGYKSDFYSDAIVRGGAAYLLGRNMQIDASVSSNFKSTPSILYGGIGFSWRYDAKYKDVGIEPTGKGKDKKQKSKKTKKQKKEKEAIEIERDRKKRYE